MHSREMYIAMQNMRLLTSVNPRPSQDSIGYSKAEVSVPPIDRRRVVSTLSYKLCLILAMRLFCRALKTSTATPALTTVRAMSKVREVPLAPRKEDEDVWSYPRPPLLQRTPK